MEKLTFDVNFIALHKSLYELNRHQANLIAALDYQANPTLMDLARLWGDSFETAVRAILVRMVPADQKVLAVWNRILDYRKCTEETEPFDVTIFGISQKVTEVTVPRFPDPADKKVDDNQMIDLFTIPLDETDLDDITCKLWIAPLGNTVRNFISRGEYSVAITHCLDTISDVRKDTKEKNSLVVSTAQNLLASAYSALENYEEAVNILTDVLKIRKTKLGEDDLSVAAVFNNLAVIHGKCENHDEAEHFGAKCWNIYVKHLRSHMIPYFSTINYNLAALKQNQGNYAAAEVHYGEVVSSCRHILNEEHVQRSLCNAIHCFGMQRKSKQVHAPYPSSSDTIEK